MSYFTRRTLLATATVFGGKVTTWTTVQRLEFPLDKPILYRMTQWEVDEAGKSTLTLDFRTVEYRLLPADTQVGPFFTGDDS